jgi:hypothetical protein
VYLIFSISSGRRPYSFRLARWRVGSAEVFGSSGAAEEEAEGDNSVMGATSAAAGLGATHVEDITIFLAQTDKRRKTQSDKALDVRVKGWIESLKAGLPQKLAVGSGEQPRSPQATFGSSDGAVLAQQRMVRERRGS